MQARQATTAVEFAICALAMVLIVVGFTEYGRLVWTYEVLQEAASEGVRCMGLRANSCAASGTFNAASTKNYIVSIATSRGVVITGSMVTLNAAATCGGATGFSQVAINYNFVTAAPVLPTSLLRGVAVLASACFPNSS